MRRVMFFLVVIYLCSNTFALSGVTPGSYEVNFEPNLEKEFVFNFVIDDGKKVDVYAEGEFSNLVMIDKNEIWGRQDVKIKLILPEKMYSPGINQIQIKAGDVTGIIKINVAYPGEFVELSLKAPDINLGEVVDIELDIFNKGNDVNINPRLEIYKVEDDIEELINTINFEEAYLVEVENYYLQLNTENYSAGNYFVRAIVEYGDEKNEVKNPFKIGEKRVDLIDYTRELKENKVGEFELSAESFWNNDFKEVYAEIKVKNSEYSFVTTSVNLKAWETKTLSGFFDASKVHGYDKELEIILYYDGQESSEIVSFEILEGFDFVLLIVLLSVFGIVGILVWRSKSFLKNIKSTKEDIK